MKALKILMVLAVVFAAAEIYSRVNYKQATLTGFMSRHSVFHHIPPPYYEGKMHSDGDFDITFTTNNRGMRGPGDCQYQKNPGIFRIAVMGDSFTFGVGVESDRTVSALLESMLNSSGDRKYEVYNFGVNSYSPLLEYIYIKREVVKYSPDLVILMLDLCDVQDDYLYEPHVVRSPSGDIAGCDPLKIRGHADIWAIATKYSRFLQTLDTKLLQSIAKMRTIGFINYVRNKFTGVRNKTKILLDKDIDNIAFDRFIFVRDGKNTGIVDAHWKRTASYIKMIRDYLDARGIRFMMALYPYGHHVGPDQWDKGRRYWAFEPGKVYDASSAFSVIEQFARDNGIRCVNTYGAFRDNGGEKLYYDGDGHCTARGQEVAARAIFDSDVFRYNIS
jgi:hypothetical protein